MVWGAVNAGVAANAIPQTGMLRGTLRTADRDTWGGLEEIVREIVSSILAPLGVEYTLQYHVAACRRWSTRTSARRDPHPRDRAPSAGRTASTTPASPSGGEDFSWYLEEVPGAMARLGVWSGRGPMRDIHQPTFDLDERALPFGVRVLTRAALAALIAPPPTV